MPFDSVADLPDYIKKKPAKAQRQWMAVWNSSFKACMAEDGGGAKSCEAEAFKKANGVIKGGEMPTDNLIRLNEVKLEKVDPKANYREAADGQGWTCGDCRFFGWNSCSLVEGTIDPSYTCNLYTEKLPMQSIHVVYSEADDTRIFLEATEVFKGKKGKKEWIPFLPKPGKYTHAEYGEVEVTEETNQALVDSVKNKVYQEHIPIDAEHETKLSGAVAWIKDMRLNDDGSGDAFVEWTDRGQTLMEGDQYRYVSPEWYHAWTDPATNEVHYHVVAGGAITTRPFFKDKVLRALVASEKGSGIIAAEEFAMHKCASCGREFTGKKCPGCGEMYKEDPVPNAIKFTEEQQAEIDKQIAAAEAKAKEGLFTEDQVKEREAAALKAAEKPEKPEEDPTTTAQFTELKTALQAAEKRAESAENKALALEKADRTKRFTDLVAGKGGSGDGAPWVGDQEAHVALLESMSEKFGEDSDEFKQHVTLQTAAAAQLAQSDIFREHGTAATPTVSDPEKKLTQMAEERQKADPKLSFHEAYALVADTPEGKRLYAESQR